MKSVTQKRKTADGDCLTACIASLLEYDYDEVPDFALETDDWLWWGSVQKWLGLRGFQMLRLQLNGNVPWFPMAFSPLCICVGPNASGLAHATIGYPEPGGDDGKQLEVMQIFDPGEAGGVESCTDLIFLVPLDPAKKINISRIHYHDDAKKHNNNGSGIAPDATGEAGSDPK
jgi:hypothetical protein